jgi:hypothetical protein
LVNLGNYDDGNTLKYAWMKKFIQKLGWKMLRKETTLKILGG